MENSKIIYIKSDIEHFEVAENAEEIVILNELSLEQFEHLQS